MGRFEERRRVEWRLRIRVRHDEDVLGRDDGHQEPALGRRERRERLGIELVLPARREILVHQEEDEKTVCRRPRARGDAERFELEPRAMGMALEERVHAGGVCLHLRALVGGQERHGRLGDLAEAVDAVEAIEGERLGAEDLAQRAGGSAPLELELEHPLARDEVALRAERIHERRRVHRGNRAGVEVDRNRRREPRQRRRLRVRDLPAHDEARGPRAERDEGRERGGDADESLSHAYCVWVRSQA